MAISEACPLPPASGLLDTASFAAVVKTFFTNRFTITAKEADILRHHQSDLFVSLIKTSVPLVQICFLLCILNDISECLLSMQQAPSWGYRDDQDLTLFTWKENMSTDAYSTLKSSAMDMATVDVLWK